MKNDDVIGYAIVKININKENKTIIYDVLKSVIFEEVINKDIERIKEYIRTHVCYRVFIPNGGFFGTKISYITKSRYPKIYNYLVIKLDELQLYINTYNPKLWD